MSAWLASAWLAVAGFADTALAADAPAGAAPATAAPATASANAAPAGTGRTPDLAAFGRLPALDNVALSPDGRRLAYVTAIGDERYLVVATIGEKPLSGAVRLGETKLREVEWIDSRHLLLTTSTTASVWGLVGPRREWFMAQVYDVESRRIRPLQPRGTSNETTMNVIVGPADVRTVEGRAMVFVRGIVVTDRTAPALFAIDPATGRSRLVARGRNPGADWLVDESGTVVAAFDYDERRERWVVSHRRDGRMAALASGEATLDVPALVGFAADGGSLLMQFVEDGQPTWKALGLADGAWRPAFGPDDGHSAALVHRTTPRVAGLYDGAALRLQLFDAEWQKRWNAIARAYPGARVRLASYADDFARFVLHVDDPRDGPFYAYADWAARSANEIGPLYPELGQLAERRAIAYPAADGLEIPGFLTLPPGREPKGLPLIVLPHGGPAAADTPDFDWWSQALAAQGYAVLQPNFRGSTLSRSFMEKGFGEWGRRMQTDLSDGVRFLAAQGTIDPRRTCIAGASYGGYAALAGVALEPDVYRCAVAVAGVSDLGRFLTWTDYSMGRGDSLAQRWWRRFMGVEGPRDPVLQQVSPVFHARAVRAPVLLIHGRDDTVVPFEQSDRMADALRAAGRPVELVTLKREDHWLSRADTRLQMLAESVRFLRQHNPPD